MSLVMTLVPALGEEYKYVQVVICGRNLLKGRPASIIAWHCLDAQNNTGFKMNCARLFDVLSVPKPEKAKDATMKVCLELGRANQSSGPEICLRIVKPTRIYT